MNRINIEPRGQRVLVRNAAGHPTWWPKELVYPKPILVEPPAPNEGGSVGLMVLAIMAIGLVGLAMFLGAWLLSSRPG